MHLRAPIQAMAMRAACQHQHAGRVALGRPSPVTSQIRITSHAVRARGLAAAAGGSKSAPDSDAQPKAAAAVDSNAVGSHLRDSPPGTPKPKATTYCRLCGSDMLLKVPAGDSMQREVCSSPACGAVQYQNPKTVVGCIVEHEGRILLCRRAIEPCRGMWNLPAGFLELGESTAAGAARETLEEAGAVVEVQAPYAHLDIPSIGQAYMLFRAKLAPPFTYAAGPETLEVAWCRPQEVPFEQLAFSSISIALKLYAQDALGGRWTYHHGVIDKAPGSAPNDPTSYRLRGHMAIASSEAVPASLRPGGAAPAAAPRT